MIRTILITCIVGLAIQLSAQDFNVQGYVFESGNRGYLYGVEIKAYDSDENLVATSYTNNDGFFEFDVPVAGDYDLDIIKSYFNPMEEKITVADGKTFLKYEMKREPGYFFEVTLAESRTDENQVVDQIKGALIEVYNNTDREPVLVLEDHQDHEFKLHMSKGNHYTILIRKEGYLAKRMEAFVNVDGCILCFEGVGDVKPGVTDNLTEGNQNGVLLANVQMDSIFRGKKLAVNNLYYDLGKWDLKAEGKEELDKVITMMTDNPHLSLLLGSHTDSRGSASSNQALSEKRAQSAVSYLRSRGVISSKRINYKGYGEEKINNGCVDGVECTDEQHARNRRTDLEIVGINDTGAIQKTLAQMKQEEFMDEMLAEIQDQGVIKVAAGDTSQLEMIEAQNNREKAKAQQLAEENKQILDAAQAKLEMEKQYDEVIEPVLVDDSGLAEKTKPIIKDPIIEEPIIEETIVKTVPDVQPVIVEETIVETEAPQPAADGFTGYRIVIREEATALDPADELWKRHDNLVVYFTGEKFIYSLGAFSTLMESQDVHKSAFSTAYPNSYIAEFANGTLVK